jgi:hypothetical protein
VAMTTSPVFTTPNIGTPSAGVLTNCTGLVSFVVADEAADTTCFPLFVTAATGELAPKTNASLIFNSATGAFGAAAFVPSGSTVPTNGMYLPAANTLAWAINSAIELQLTSAALSPGASAGLDLGTTSLQYGTIHLNNAINFGNGGVILSRSAGVLTMTAGELRITSANVGANNDSVPTLASTSIFTNKTLTSPAINTPTISAPITTYTVEPGTDDTAYGDRISGFNAGATIAQWDAVYLSTSSTWLLTDADAAATAGPVMVAMAVSSGTNGNPLTVLRRGIVRNDGWAWASAGLPLYLDTTTPGGLTTTAPSGTDDIVRVVGYTLSDDCIWFDPSNDWITRV